MERTVSLASCCYQLLGEQATSVTVEKKYNIVNICENGDWPMVGQLHDYFLPVNVSIGLPERDSKVRTEKNSLILSFSSPMWGLFV